MASPRSCALPPSRGPRDPSPRPPPPRPGALVLWSRRWQWWAGPPPPPPGHSSIQRPRGGGQRKPSNDPRNNQHNPRDANYWAPLTRTRHPPRPAQPRHTNDGAPNDTSGSTGRSGRQNAATRRNMRREERVTVQGPVKKQPPDGMSHGGGGVLSGAGPIRRQTEPQRVRSPQEITATGDEGDGAAALPTPAHRPVWGGRPWGGGWAQREAMPRLVGGSVPPHPRPRGHIPHCHGLGAPPPGLPRSPPLDCLRERDTPGPGRCRVVIHKHMYTCARARATRTGGPFARGRAGRLGGGFPVAVRRGSSWGRMGYLHCHRRCPGPAPNSDQVRGLQCDPQRGGEGRA